METHRDDLSKRAFTGLSCSLHPDAGTRKAVEVAILRTQQILANANLLTPSDALAVAGKTAREKETLFSIARAVAWETDTDQDEILCRLGEKFPDFA
ncbi:MAG TPA: hypothetical protein VHO24_07480 [Opitutaceae bacterium]|nr:hypothetical protein [Opitutaceae bacterium]